MLTEQSVVDKIEIFEDGTIGMRTANRIFRDDVLVSETYVRKVLPPGYDAKELDTKVQSVVALIHTKKVVDAFNEKLAKIKKDKEDKDNL